MLIAVLNMIVAVSAVWVYLDATKNKIGRVPGKKGVFSMSAGGWAITTLLLWIVAFPAYLLKRRALILNAREHPVVVAHRSIKIGLLAVPAGLAAFSAISGAVMNSLPGCDSANTKQLVSQIINDMPLMKSFGAQFVALKDIAEQGYNEEAGIRACGATLVTTAGENGLQYSIKWDDKKNGNYYVEARIQ